MVPLGVELLMTLLFCGVLVSLRRSLTTSGLIFWAFLWIARGAGTLFVMRYVSGTERVFAFVYAPIQIAFALALVAIALRLESQKEQLKTLNLELERLRKQTAAQADTDPLTGLLSRSALERWISEERDFAGLVVVCDMDDFKRLNDDFGHMVGDEILHGVGKLVRNSIRERDLAFRWGGDEFVIFFRSHDHALVESRMRMIEDRLTHFHIREHGPITVRFSWGFAESGARGLRETLAEADRLMYEQKRSRRAAASR
jgi:diguanylate cyclase (GGDEF)-like protein